VTDSGVVLCDCSMQQRPVDESDESKKLKPEKNLETFACFGVCSSMTSSVANAARPLDASAAAAPWFPGHRSLNTVWCTRELSECSVVVPPRDRRHPGRCRALPQCCLWEVNMHGERIRVCCPPCVGR
jgi:hypothetical protein